MRAPTILSRETVCELPRGADNPRNSEGDFARLRDGSILFAYSRYSGDNANDDAPCDIAALLSRDGGRTFAPLPHLLVSAPEHGVRNVMSVTLRRLPNGRLALFYLGKHDPQSAYYIRLADPADETVFRATQTVIPQHDGVYYVVNNCRVLVTRDGRILVPAARHKTLPPGQGGEDGDAEYFASSALFASCDGGTHFSPLPHVFALPEPGYSETGLQEPGVIELPDGTLYAYFRTDRAFQYESVSADGGAHWSVPKPSRFTSPESPMLIVRNPYSGLYYAFWNPIPLYNGRIDPDAPWIAAGRTPFVMAVSENGTDFSPYTVLEDDPAHGYCYPAVLFLRARELLLSYCCGGPEDGNCLTRTRILRLTIG